MTLIIDVRTPEEFEAEHIDGALNVNVEEITLGSIPEVKKNTEIFLYCRSGGRASRAKAVLESKGFTSVHNGGGINDMRDRGYTIIKK